MAYLVGRREFYSLSFRVGPEVLIPRPETELLLVALLDLAKQRGRRGPCEIADVGTGSGIIAICAAKHLARLPRDGRRPQPRGLGDRRSQRRRARRRRADRVVESDLFAALAGRADVRFRCQQSALRQRGGVRAGGRRK